MGELVYLNGELYTPDGASVSINDRSFLFGDGVYEVIRSYGGRLFGLDEHIQRLFRSAAALDLQVPLDAAGLKDLVRTVHRKSEIADAMIYIHVSRGTEPRNHLFSIDLRPAVLVTVRHLPDDLFENGLQETEAITVHDGRWDMCHVKCTSLVANILAKHKARQAGVDEAVFVRADGTVTEAYASNVFIVKDGKVYTHPADNHILGGITRFFVLRLCRELGLPVEERRFSKEEMMAADEVMVTNSVHEIRAIIRIDGQPIADGHAGPVSQRLLKAYRELTNLDD